MSKGREDDGATEPASQVADLGSQLEAYRPRLRRLVSLRLDPRLRRRVDSSDVLQEAFTEVTQRIDEYRAKRDTPFFLWVRLITAQKLAEFHRRHFGAAMRDVRREVAGPDYPEASSASLAHALVDQAPTPAQDALRKEQEERLRAALEDLKPVDREILMLRHFEQLTNEECARVLGITPPSAFVRHMRAAERLQGILRAHTDLLEGPPGL